LNRHIFIFSARLQVGPQRRPPLYHPVRLYRSTSMLEFGFNLLAVYVECLVVREVLERFLSEHFCYPVPLIFHQYAYLSLVSRKEDNVTFGLDVNISFGNNALLWLVPRVRCLIVLCVKGRSSLFADYWL